MTAKKAHQAEEATEVFPAEEFASVAIRIDHLANIPGKTVQALIMSTGTAPEEVLALMNYHGRRVEVGDSIQIAKATEIAAAFLLPVDARMSYIIVDRAAWDEVKADRERGNGSDLQTVAVFVMLANELRRQAKAQGVPADRVLSWLSE